MQERAEYYLHADSRKPVIEAVQAELLLGVQTALLEKDSGMSAMLRDGQNADLARLFRLYHRCGNDAIAPLSEIFREHIKREGLALVSAVSAAGGADDAATGGGTGAAASAAKRDASAAEMNYVRKVLELQVRHRHRRRRGRQRCPVHMCFWVGGRRQPPG